MTVGKQQRQEHQQGGIWRPQPGGDPSRSLASRQRARMCQQRVDSVLAAKVVQPHNETCCTEQPAYGVLGAAGGEEKPECRKDHTNKSTQNPDAVDFHLRVKKVQGEEKEGW